MTLARRVVSAIFAVGALCFFQSNASAQPIDLPSDFPALRYDVKGDTSKVMPGKIFMSNFIAGAPNGVSPYLFVLNKDGSVYWKEKTAKGAFDFKVLRNGTLACWDSVVRAYVIRDSAFSPIDTIGCQGYPTDSHDIQVTESGHYYLLSYNPRHVNMRQYLGRADALEDAIVFDPVIQEIDQSGSAVWTWDGKDHFQIDTTTKENVLGATVDYHHANSLDIDLDGNLVLSGRHFDEITKISRASGDIVWRFGGVHNQFTFVDDPENGFWHQHDVRRLANGHLTMFDNGNFHVPPHSRAVEYELDESNKTAKLVWQYRHSPDIYGFATGSVQRFTNGNTLIDWGLTQAVPSVISEVTANNDLLYEITLPQNNVSYRALKFSWPDARPSSVSRSIEPKLSTEIVPNPVSSAADVMVTIASPGLLKIDLFDLLGRKVASLLDGHFTAGSYTAKLNARSIPPGPYFIRTALNATVTYSTIVVAK